MNVLTLFKRSPFVFALAFVAAAGMVTISEGSYWQSSGTLKDLREMGAARQSIQGLQQGVLAAEAAQRSVLQGSRPEQLQAYAQARRDIDESLRFLDQYYADEPEPRQLLGRLRSAAGLRLAQLEAGLQARGPGIARPGERPQADALRRPRPVGNQQSGKATFAGEPAGITEPDDTGRVQMDAVRSLGAALLEHEALTVAASRQALNHTLMLGRVGVSVLSAVSLLALFMVLRQTFAMERQQQEQQRLVQAERDRLEIEVANRTRQLTELASHLQTAREDERHRLARDLHDELGALLTSAKLDAARIRSRLAGSAAEVPAALERLQHLVGTLNTVIALKRRIVEDLRPSALSNLGLVATLEILAREFTEHSGVAVHCSLAPVRLGPAAELVVYRLVQEAITNISKYARARQVWLGLGVRDGQVEVSVRDDGVGFDPGALRGGAYGLMGMRFRVEAERGSLALVSAPGTGTLIQVRLPQAGLVSEEVAQADGVVVSLLA